MDYESLPLAYRTAQYERIGKAVRRLEEGGDELRPGRVVPEDDTLVIGTGRALKLAVLFLDICGFSARPGDSHADQHVLLQELSLFFTEMVHIARDYGGTVEKNTGDGLMAYFDESAGAAQGARQRALGAAMTMMSTNDDILTPLAAHFGRSPMAFRVGIDYGPVTVARVGARRGFNANVAIGTAANIASKMLSKAGRGDILVGQSVLSGLPPEWLPWAHFLGESGFTYVTTGQPYPLFRYSGRWIVGARG